MIKLIKSILSKINTRVHLKSFNQDEIASIHDVEKPSSVRLLYTDSQSGLQRRKFLGMSLLGLGGLTLPISSKAARSAGDILENSRINQFLGGAENTYWDRTDRFEEKMSLLQSAWKRKDYRVVRALTDSLRTTCMQAQVSEETPGVPLIGPSQYGKVESLSGSWKAWAKGWKYYKVVDVTSSWVEKDRDITPPLLGYPLTATPTELFVSREPIEISLGFAANQISSPYREIRVAQLEDGILKEITSQVFDAKRRDGEWFCKLIFLAASGRKQTFMVFYGNPDAELPEYPSDLVTTGEGYGLDIENDFFIASLSRQHGQLEKITLKREHGLNLYAGGEGHGEAPGIDWAHDYVSEGGFQKLRTTLWGECPDYEVVKGPVCTIIRRWGFPYSPVHPLFSPSRLNMDVEYRFYSGLPYFNKSARMTALKDFDAAALRDDEWVFTGQGFDEIVWMGPDGKLNIGSVDPAFQNNLWGVGFFNKETKDSFIGLFLEHRADGLPELRHSGSPMLYYRWHGAVWSRYPLYEKSIPSGTVLHQKNAYVLLPFTSTDGPAMIEELRRRLKNSLIVRAGDDISDKIVAKESAGRLARRGEAGDSPISKELLWDALGNVKDAQLYTADISIADLGLVYDLRVRDDIVTVVLAMPHRGRAVGAYFDYSSNSVAAKISMTIPDALRRVPGVRGVKVIQTWYPGWDSNLVTDQGREKLGL